MAGDKAWKLSASPTLHLSSVVPRRPQSHLCPEGSFEADGLRISWGKKGCDLTQAGLSEGTLYVPVYHALKGGHAGPFEVSDHPAGTLKTCRRWTFMPLAESYSIFIHLLMFFFFFFEGGTRRSILCLKQLQREGSQTGLGLFTCFLLGYFLIWHCRRVTSVWLQVSTAGELTPTWL